MNQGEEKIMAGPVKRHLAIIKGFICIEGTSMHKRIHAVVYRHNLRNSFKVESETDVLLKSIGPFPNDVSYILGIFHPFPPLLIQFGHPPHY